MWSPLASPTSSPRSSSPSSSSSAQRPIRYRGSNRLLSFASSRALEPNHQAETPEEAKASQRKALRESQHKSLHQTLHALGDMLSECSHLYRALDRFLGGDQTLASRTFSVFLPRPGRIAAAAAGQEEVRDDGVVADLTACEILDLHVYARLFGLLKDATALRKGLSKDKGGDDEGEETTATTATEEEEQRRDEKTQEEILALAKSAAAASHLVARKLRPWREIFWENLRWDHARKTAALEEFVLIVDAWLRDQRSSSSSR
ncbi:hypothetical protein GGTG_02161 [Gaeumannomyces tritici R3-111a-1]|uniref:Uncharacterized protein n=1 Tax=Gaeumannomyces tritici (strain R3-111a-1) TaxID=644352 RepID=J3NLL2_GAET3|nr:hypothetical protein GGTG_02161 [Gaeumannomyces tritici R3-111a-1]EJT82187.1 hypothetical protein GGTG_02161 [Gaeumannomyces tritici R3-111a-1]